MKSIDRLRTASPVPRNNSGVRRPPLNAVVPGVTSVSDIGGGRARVRRRILISVAAAACVAAAAAAAITLPQLLAAPEPMTDSAYYETFEQLEAASDAIVYGTVTGEQATVFEGTDMIAYTVVVEAATDGVSGEIEVLVPSAGEGNDPTAETEPLPDQRAVCACSDSFERTLAAHVPGGTERVPSEQWNRRRESRRFHLGNRLRGEHLGNQLTTTWVGAVNDQLPPPTALTR